MRYEPADDHLAPADFRTRLIETGSGGRRIFAPLPAGEYHLSIQASADHASTPQANVPPDEVSEWEVALFRHGRWLGPDSAPEIFYDPLWTQFWAKHPRPGRPAGRYVPTAVVQTFYDLLHVGRERYERYLAFDAFLSGDGGRSPTFS